MVNPCLGKLLQHMLEMSCYLVKASIHGCVSMCCDVGQVWGRRDLEPENRMWEKRWGKRNQEKGSWEKSGKRSWGKRSLLWLQAQEQGNTTDMQ